MIKDGVSSGGLPTRVLIGAVLGILAGISFGEYCAVLKPIGIAYVMMLQALVYPYIVCSLVHGLGQLSPMRSLRLLKRCWPFYVIAWGGTFASILLLSRAIPPVPPPTTIDFSAVGRMGPGLLQLLIPADIFTALTENYVPAVVLFSICFGIAVQGLEEKESLLRVLRVIRSVSVTIWGWIVHLAPFAVFAMFADTAGTIDMPAMRALVLYLVLFLGGTTLLAFVVFPMLISALTPIHYRCILRDLRSAFVLSAVTSLSVVSLPFVQQAARKIADQCKIEEQDCDEIIDTTLSISYPLGQLGNFFVCLFIFFAAFYFKTPLRGVDSIALPPMTLLSCIGSPSSTYGAVSFLGSWLHLPDEITTLYATTGTITRYGQVLLSVMGFAFLTILATLAYYGKLRIQVRRLAVSVTLSVILLVAFVVGAHGLLLGLPTKTPNQWLSFVLDKETVRGVHATVLRNAKDPQQAQAQGAMRPGETTFERIRRTQTLRVGYNAQIIPFCYFNRHGDLVGYDIAFAYSLAGALNVKLEFVPFDWEQLFDDLKSARFDIAMSGIWSTEERLKEPVMSRHYFLTPIALIVPSDRAAEFRDSDSINSIPNLRLATSNDRILYALVEKTFPNAQITPIPNWDCLADNASVDGAVWTLEQASIWAAAHPGFTAVKPKNLGAVAVLAYLMPPNSPALFQFVDRWLFLKQEDGFEARQYNYWILGKPRTVQQPRWSIIRDVLSWMR